MTVQEDLLQNYLQELAGGRLTLEECLALHPSEAEELRPLLTVAERYRRAPLVAPSPEFQAAARSRMLNLVASPGPEQQANPPRERAHPLPRRILAGRLLPVAISLLALLTAASVTAFAASEAPPASPLYATRLALDGLRVMLAASDAERAELHLSIAEARIADLSAMEDSATGAEMDRVADLYLAAAAAALQEAAGPEAPAPELVALESRLSSQERELQGVLEERASRGREIPAEVVGALGFLERQRTELRNRAAVGAPAPGATPTAAGNEQSLSGRDGQAEGISPSPSSTPTPPPAANETQEPSTTSTLDGAGYRWGQPEAPAPVPGSPQPGKLPGMEGASSQLRDGVAPSPTPGPPTPAGSAATATASSVDGPGPGSPLPSSTATPAPGWQQGQGGQQGPGPATTPIPSGGSGQLVTPSPTADAPVLSATAPPATPTPAPAGPGKAETPTRDNSPGPSGPPSSSRGGGGR